MSYVNEESKGWLVLCFLFYLYIFFAGRVVDGHICLLAFYLAGYVDQGVGRGARELGDSLTDGDVVDCVQKQGKIISQGERHGNAEKVHTLEFA